MEEGGMKMKEKEAREMLKELFERHNAPSIPIKFYPKPIITKEKLTTDLGGELTETTTTKGTFNINLATGECWFEFYGLPSPGDVRHEFRHYLASLGVEYVRKKN